MILAVICVLFATQEASAVIYRLNGSAYAQLPALFQLDEYDACLRAPGDTYCYLDAWLVANETSPLLTTIQEYSAYSTTHFDHRVVHRGLCARGCAGAGTGRTRALEACLNDTLYRTHRLQSRVIEEKVVCTSFGEGPGLDWADCAVAAGAAALLALAVAGSWLDGARASHGTGHKLLLCFSVRRNWRRLVAPPAEGPDPYLRRLKCFNGLKLFTTVFVILGHTPLGPMATTSNPQYFETTYHSPLYALIYNGSLIVQTFFLLSGFLLAYNVLRQRRVSWDMLPKGVVLRWLRLTPPYAAVLAFVCTWQRHVGDGPLWQAIVGVEVRDCRRDWYYSLLYLNNYIDGSQCIAQSWYLGADMQLSVLGLAVFCLLRGARARRAAVAALLVLGVLAPAAHTYFQNLNAILLVTPEVARNFFVFDPTFNYVYKRGHTNAACYALGLALGVAVHRLQQQQQQFDVTKYKKYRVLYWALIPFGFLQIMSGAVFYMDGIEVPLAVRVVYSSAIKVMFGLTGCVFIAGTVFKLESPVRGLLEWRALAAPARASYCAFLLHAAVVRNAAAAHHQLLRSSSYLIALNYASVLTVSFLLAFPCWLLVEAPCAQLVKLCMGPGSEENNPAKEKPISMLTPVAVIETNEIDVIQVRL